MNNTILTKILSKFWPFCRKKGKKYKITKKIYQNNKIKIYNKMMIIIIFFAIQSYLFLIKIW